MKADRQARINLLSYLQEEAERRRKSQRKVIVVIAINILLVSTAAVAWWSQNQQVKALEQEYRQLQEQVEDLSEAATAGGISDQEVRELGLRKALLDKLEEERTFDPDQLEEIYALSIPHITISKMDMKNSGEITIHAYAGTQTDLIAFLEKLENEDFVKDIQKISSRRNKQTGEISFSLVIAGEMNIR